MGKVCQGSNAESLHWGSSRGLEMLVFRKILRTYVMDGFLADHKNIRITLSPYIG